jgi:hypothetical protein
MSRTRAHQRETATVDYGEACKAAEIVARAHTDPNSVEFTEYDHFADRALCDDVLRRG